MRILFLMTTYQLYQERCGPLAQMLKDAGHEVLGIAHAPSAKDPPEAIICSWPSFQLDPVEKFSPDLIIVWNGYFAYMAAVVQWLRTRYKVMCVEMGWYPQKLYSYLAESVASRSRIAQVPYEPGVTRSDPHQMLLFKARDSYDLALPKDAKLPDNYIFVPMQLEYDTQITLSSPMFKSMDSLLGFIRKRFPRIAIVYRNHPMEPGIGRDPTIPNAVNMSDKSPSMPLAARADVVIGINSTLLAESMLLGRPTVAFGEHVAAKDIGIDPMAYWQSWEGRLLSAHPFKNPVKDRYDFRSLVLLYNQWDYKNPPGWIVDKISSLDFAPRIPRK